jgi:GT2 family glycosyltransferase/SAM-dependent methyltransferase
MSASSAIVPDAERPAEAPAVQGDPRAQLAAEYLRGGGVEIGALHQPMPVPPGVGVTYVDRMTVEDLREHYPELAELALTPVDVVDDGERLVTFADESIDFLVANHFLEHCENPIGTIETHLRKLRPGGVLFYAVPDKRYTFDFRRPRTTLAHVIGDYENGPDASRPDHYLEWERMIYEPGTPAPEESVALSKADRHEREGYSIHFHVWTQADLLELFMHCRDRFETFDLEAVRRSGLENIVVLRKRGELVAAAPAPGAAPPPAPTPADAAPETSEARIPLSALRARLDVGSQDAQWSVDVSGTTGRSLVQAAESAIEFPLRLAGLVRFSAQTALIDLDWRDARGAIRPWVAVVDQAGARRTLWSGSLLCAADGGEPDALPVDCELPSSTQSLVLGCDQVLPRRGMPVGRALWLEAVIADPAAPGGPVVGEPAQGPESVAPHRPASTDAPLISVLTPVHDPPLAMLEEAIWSVRRQSFADWELCLSDDGSRDPEVIAALQRHVDEDKRIRLVRRDQAGGISVATNAALELARGEYIALLDHDDWLEPDTLETVAGMVSADPTLDMLYSDEDVVADGRRIARHLKPEWSPESFCSAMYTCHVGVYRRELALGLGGFRPEFDGSQDYDFVLRVTEATDRIAHIPRILYHWRAHAHSAAGGEEAKPFAYTAARRAISAHLERIGRTAEVQFGTFPGLYRVVHEVDPSLTVAIVLAPAAAGPPPEALTESARSWAAQSHPSWEVVFAAPSESLHAYAHALRAGGVEHSRITAVATAPAADSTTALASAAAATGAEQLVLMQSPAVGLTHDWMTRLAGYCSDPAIGAAGPVVLSADGRIERAGVAVSGGLPLFLLHGLDAIMGGPTVLNVSAVTGVVATRRETFERLQGLRSGLGELATVDYCLRATAAGMRVVTVPDARLRAIPDGGPVNDLPAIWRLRQAWGPAVARDPYYNPGYRQDRGDFTPVK